MSNGTNLIDSNELIELREMVQNIISDHQLIVQGAHRPLSDNFQEQCTVCQTNIAQIHNHYLNNLSNISNQIINLGNFTISILDQLTQIQEKNQQQTNDFKVLQNHNCILKEQNFYLNQQIIQSRAKIFELQQNIQEINKEVFKLESIGKNEQKIINQLKFQNAEIKKLFSQSSIQSLQALNIEMTFLKQQNMKILTKNKELELQIRLLILDLQKMHENAIEKNYLKSSCSKTKNSPNILEVYEANVEDFYTSAYQIKDQSSYLKQLGSTLQKQLQKTDNFSYSINSPELNRSDPDSILKIYSTIKQKPQFLKYSITEFNDDIQNKQNIPLFNHDYEINQTSIDNQVGLLHPLTNISLQKSFKTNSNLKIQKSKSLTYLQQLDPNKSPHLGESQQFISILQKSHSQKQIEFLPKKVVQPFEQISLGFFGRFAKFISEKFVRNRIKIKNKAIFEKQYSKKHLLY